MDPFAVWYGTFAVLLALWLLITRQDRKYFFYFLSGALLGFLFDTLAFNSGVYSYPGFFLLKITGLPLSMTLAEGFSVALVIWGYNKLVAPRIK